ncbi:MAG: hypothetical protein HY582_01170, partial [Candidatus Omnitrophica bacterium]|nr:hypothetical protein [Candidatus Omnitrophota bacterium]
MKLGKLATRIIANLLILTFVGSNSISYSSSAQMGTGNPSLLNSILGTSDNSLVRPESFEGTDSGKAYLDRFAGGYGGPNFGGVG